MDNPWQRKNAGGFFGVVFSFIFEMILSALVAPIMMLIHSGAVTSILIGQDAGWNPQRRDDGSLPIKDLIYRHRWHMVMGVFLTVFAALNSWALLAWLSPAVAGMLLAVPLSQFTSSFAIGSWFKRIGVLRTPEESRKPKVLREFEQTLDAYHQEKQHWPDLAGFLLDENWSGWHVRVADTVPPRARGQVEAMEAVATMKVDESSSISELLGFLAPKEQLMVLNNPALFEKAQALAAQERQNTAQLAAV